MSTHVRLEFDDFKTAVFAAFGIQTGATLFVWHSKLTGKWVLSDWNNKDEDDAGGVWLGVRPDAELHHKWLSDPILTPNSEG